MQRTFQANWPIYEIYFQAGFVHGVPLPSVNMDHSEKVTHTIQIDMPLCFFIIIIIVIIDFIYFFITLDICDNVKYSSDFWPSVSIVKTCQWSHFALTICLILCEFVYDNGTSKLINYLLVCLKNRNPWKLIWYNFIKTNFSMKICNCVYCLFIKMSVFIFEYYLRSLKWQQKKVTLFTCQNFILANMFV